MRKIITIIFFTLALISCKKADDQEPTTRTYRMGMQNSAPRYDDINLVLQVLGLWTSRADAAMITTEVPWDSLYSGQTPQQYVLQNYTSLVDYYRTKNLKLWVYIDPANGLNRTSDADALVRLGKSMTDPDVQKIYRRFCVVIDSMLNPDHLGLALETNLIRQLSTPELYAAVKKASNDAAKDVRAAGSDVKLSISIQADVAWGKTYGMDYNYVGVDQDFADFPFLQELGISSYPYFNWTQPEDMPLEYYSKLVEGKSLDIFVSEGGWTSESFTDLNSKSIISSPENQGRYIVQHGKILDKAKAKAYFQLVFTDIDLTQVPDGTNPILKYFANLGLVDKDLQSKPALAAWDKLYNRKIIE